MPSTLSAPVLTVDVGLIHKVDTRNVENLFSMWTVFSRCAGSLEEGRRLENLSWRLWNRETFCCDPVSAANSTTQAISTCSRSSDGHYASNVPELSASFDSLVDEDALEFDSDHSRSSTSPLNISRPHIVRQDSLNTRSRGRESHITSDDLQKMVITIKEKKDLSELSLALSGHSYLAPITPTPESKEVLETKQAPNAPILVESLTSASGSDDSPQVLPSSISSATSAMSERSTTSVVKGFSPAQISSSYRSIPLLTAPHSISSADIAAAKSSPVATHIAKKRMFALGGSSASADDSMSEHNNSLDASAQQPKKKPTFLLGGSSNEDELSLPTRYPKSALTAAIQKPPKKQTSFQEEVATRSLDTEQPFDDDVFETDDEDDIDESAIDDDDDSSEWEDSNEESGNPSIDEKTFFQRIDSKPTLTSRRSLLTVALHQNDRMHGMAAQAALVSRSSPALQRSRTSSPSGPSLAASPDSDEAPLMMKKGLRPIAEIPRSVAQPIIMTTTNNTSHQLALSPRTTRRNMLATELTVSLRQHLLWERQQKSQTANAVLKRRHTAHDVANLRQYPDKVHMGKELEANNASWNQYFSQGLGEYHSKGW